MPQRNDYVDRCHVQLMQDHCVTGFAFPSNHFNLLLLESSFFCREIALSWRSVTSMARTLAIMICNAALLYDNVLGRPLCLRSSVLKLISAEPYQVLHYARERETSRDKSQSHRLSSRRIVVTAKVRMGMTNAFDEQQISHAVVQAPTSRQ